MTVDYYEPSVSSNTNQFVVDDCLQRQDSSDWSPPVQRPHLRLYERQQASSGAHQQTATTPQSPLNGDSSFGCWSPISQNDEDQVKWSNGYDDSAAWMKNSSSENSTTSSTEDYEPETFIPFASNHYQQQQHYSQWSSNHQNDENIMSQMMKLNLVDYNNQDVQQPTTNPAMRKWSQEDQSTTAKNIAQHNFYALYIQQQQQPSPIQQRHHSVADDRSFIPVSNAKWSTASDTLLSMHPKPSHQAFSHQTSLPTGNELRTNRGRPIFAQLNASYSIPNQRQGPTMSCNDEEIQRYHHNLEMQHSVYDQIYSKILSGELKKKNAAKQAQQDEYSIPQTPIERHPNPLTSLSSNPLAMDLVARLDQCTTQYRQLEKERKKTEAELAKHHLGKKISSSNNLQIPRLPTAPSRIDRLIVDFFREHARVVTLLCRMEQLRGIQFEENLHKVMIEWLDSIKMLQQRRLNDRNAILSHLNGGLGFYDMEKESASQKEALATLTKTAIRARSANWCALILTLGADSPMQQAQLERIQTLDYRCEPPEIPSRPLA